MASETISDCGTGPEIVGMRLTVYHLLPHLLDPTVTETEVCRLYGLTPEQVAAARAYILNNPDTVLAEHLRIEDRIAQGNPPEVAEKARRTRELFFQFRDWAKAHQAEIEREQKTPTMSGIKLPTFREWLAEQESQGVKGA